MASAEAQALDGRQSLAEGRQQQRRNLASLAAALEACEARRSSACQREAEARGAALEEAGRRLAAERERLSVERR